MDRIRIEGGERLTGEVNISGAKNASLPIMAATLLAEGESVISNLPGLRDIETIKSLLIHLGAKIEEENGDLRIDTSRLSCWEAPYDLVKTMRASVLVLGPLLSRLKAAKVSLPGGCAIGARPINLHLMGFERLGANIKINHGYVMARADRLKGSRIYFDIPTVTGTENIMMAASLSEGISILENAACEPEVVDLARALKSMGAMIEGAGTDVITIEGVKKLKPLKHTVMSDRIEAGTYMIAAGITKGDILINNCPLEHLDALTHKLNETGIEIRRENGKVRVVGNGSISSVDIKTLPHPGFPTDMQAQLMALMCRSEGLSVITETVFDDRFLHVSELKRMGADIHVEGRSAIVKGTPSLSGAQVMATDLRASASLVLAGLAADGITEISRIYHLDRGYESLEEKLSNLGAKIKRIKE
ncbi:MAG: UDP-N-acetylglucosamine 1-carboxyvinyltransferase [Thermodesulfobacteriota bacterium]